MRTRIALVAIIPVALITVSTCTQAALAQPVRAVPKPSTLRRVAMAPVDSVVHRVPALRSPAAGKATLPFLDSPLLVRHLVTTTGASTPNTAALAALSTPPTPPAPAAVGPVDTVTPEQREGWEQVAMCEEGGDWGSDGSSFSGGLGISRANWDAYGGLEFAPEGADASEDQQIMVAERIQPSPPDQDGCRGW
jgi:hypothetical protein